MTPLQLKLAAEAYNEEKLEASEQKRHELYLQATLIRIFVWAKKKPPTYEKIFGKIKKCEMSDDELYKQVVALNKAFGGTDKRGDIDGGS